MYGSAKLHLSAVSSRLAPFQLLSVTKAISSAPISSAYGAWLVTMTVITTPSPSGAGDHSLTTFSWPSTEVDWPNASCMDKSEVQKELANRARTAPFFGTAGASAP
jgi:hypothetical protein